MLGFELPNLLPLLHIPKPNQGAYLDSLNYDRDVYLVKEIDLPRSKIIMAIRKIDNAKVGGNITATMLRLLSDHIYE